jgi:hypothetical protein
MSPEEQVDLKKASIGRMSPEKDVVLKSDSIGLHTKGCPRRSRST